VEKDNHEILMTPGVVSFHAASLAGRVRTISEAYQIRHAASLHLNPSHMPQRIFNGRYGLELLYPETMEIMAVSGMDFDTDGGKIVLTTQHLAQGALRGELSRNARRALLPLPFRDILTQEIISIGYEIAASKVIVVSALNHYKVKSGELSMDTALRIIDNVALNNGFEYGEGGNLVFPVKQEPRP
jgi:hypothetical protein